MQNYAQINYFLVRPFPLAKQSHTLHFNYPCVIDNNKEDTNLNFRWSLLTICISPASYIVSTIVHQR